MKKSKSTKRTRYLVCLLALIVMVSQVPFSFASASASSTSGLSLNMGTGGTGQGLYAMGVSISNAIRHNTDFQVTAQTTAGSVANVALLSQGEVDMIIVSSGDSDVLASVPDARLLYVAAPYAIQFGMLLESNYESVESMKGCRFAVPTPGTGGFTSTKAVLDALGYDFNYFNTSYMSVADATEAFKDGKLDVMGQISTIPHPGWYEVSVTGKGIKIFQFTDDEMNKIMESTKDYSPVVIPAETYGGQTQDITTLGIWGRILCTAEMSDDLAYAITKVMHENYDELVQGYGQMKDATLENTLELAKTSAIPLHPGAIKYFEEIGAL